MLRLWENPMLSIEDRLEAASGEIERVCAQRDAAVEEIDRLNKDAARLDWMEGEAATSRTGVSIDYRKYVEDGCVLEKGYRLMRHHKIFEARPSLREAIDAAMINP